MDNPESSTWDFESMIDVKEEIFTIFNICRSIWRECEAFFFSNCIVKEGYITLLCEDFRWIESIPRRGKIRIKTKKRWLNAQRNMHLGSFCVDDTSMILKFTRCLILTKCSWLLKPKTQWTFLPNQLGKIVSREEDEMVRFCKGNYHSACHGRWKGLGFHKPGRDASKRSKGYLKTKAFKAEKP